MEAQNSDAHRPLLELDPDEPLQRLPDLALEFRSDGWIRVDPHGRDILCGPHAIRVLEAFSKPLTLKNALKTLQSQVTGIQDWVDLSDTIVNLFRAGALEPVTGALDRRRTGAGFDSPIEHVSMLNDRARTGAYLRAIREVVKPGDVVLELGTGTGVLAVAAAKAGARHVYTIEVGSIGKVAEAIFADNGLSDRITLISGLSTQVTVPERADVLISEIIGNEPLNERVLQSTRDAILRFLKPQARFVPRTLRIHAVPVEVPESVMSKLMFRESSQANWSGWYEMNFDSLSRGNAPEPFNIFARPHRLKDWARMSEPVLLSEIDFSIGHPPSVLSESYIVATRNGTLNGIVLYFELGLCPGVWLSVDPETASEECSWRVPVWLLPTALEVKSGERLRCKYTYGTENRHGWVSIARAES